MSIDKKNSVLTEQICSALPFTVSEISCGPGSMVSLDIAGESGHDSILRSIWIYLCRWSVHRGGNDLLDSDANLLDPEVGSVLAGHLKGIVIDSIEFDLNSNKVDMLSRQGISIHIESDLFSYEKDDDMVVFFLENNPPISISPAKKIYAGW